jgi:para-nitrobenzyl esterase
MLRKVTVENGIVEGIPAADARITAFKGIPFAAAPVGDLRWKAPKPAKNWEGVLKAYTFGPLAMQETPGLNPNDIYTNEWHVDSDVPISEDCLQLNVWTPAKRVDEKLPVMIWIYGGGLNVGYPSEMEFDGERIARRGVILVSINYRVNVFGFLSHPELTAEDPVKSTNFGHWDQKFAIEWVKRNIAAFGGDPNNLLIFGQSAGGGSTQIQVASPLNKGLFQKAIVHSGGGLLPPANNAPTLDKAEKMGEKFFEFIGVKTLKEARALDAKYVLQKGREFGRMVWGSIIDGTLIPDYPTNIFLQNKRNPVAIMTGNTLGEFPVRSRANSVEEFEAEARKKFGEDAGRYLAIAQKGANGLDDMINNTAYNRFEIGNLLWADANAALGAGKMYYYNFDPEIPGPDHPGSFHSSDLWFAFETLAKCSRPYVGKHYDLARQMCNYWTNFSKSSDPNGNDADGSAMPYWKETSAGATYPMFFGDRAQMDLTPRTELKNFLVEFFMKKLKSGDYHGFYEM